MGDVLACVVGLSLFCWACFSLFGFPSSKAPSEGINEMMDGAQGQVETAVSKLVLDPLPQLL